MKNSVHPLPGLQERMNRRKKKSGRKGPRSWAWRLAETHEPHGSWQSAPRLFIFPPTTPSNSGNNFSSPTRRPLLVVVLDARWKKTKSQEQTNFTGFPRNQDGDIEEAAYNNKPLRPRLLCPSITSCVCRSRHLRRIWFEARREVSLLIIGDLTPSVRFDLLMRPAGLVVFGCDCCDCFVGLRQAMTLILEFVLLVGCSVGRG